MKTVEPKTKLNHKYTFYYRISDYVISGAASNTNKGGNNYSVTKLGEFDTVEDFWKIYQHIQKPTTLKTGIDLELFKDSIQPMWEDPMNKSGGKIIIKLKKELTANVWEDLLLQIIGETLPRELNDCINGVLWNIKNDYNSLQIWFKDYDKQNIDLLQEEVKTALQIPKEINWGADRFDSRVKYKK